MRKQGIRKSLGVFLAMCFLSVIYVVFHSDKDVLDDVIKRQSVGSKDYVGTWQDETFDMTITYKKQGQAANAGQFLSKEKTKKELVKSD